MAWLQQGSEALLNGPMPLRLLAATRKMQLVLGSSCIDEAYTSLVAPGTKCEPTVCHNASCWHCCCSRKERMTATESSRALPGIAHLTTMEAEVADTH